MGRRTSTTTHPTTPATRSSSADGTATSSSSGSPGEPREPRGLNIRWIELWSSPHMVNVCFWYIPERLRGQPRTKDWELELGRITAQLKSRMMYSGTLMISYQPLKDKPNFFRSVISNQACTEEDIDFMLEELDRLGIDL